MRRAALAVAVLLLFAAAPARANWSTRAQQIAAAYWGQTACQGHVSITASPVWPRGWAEAYAGDCRVVFDPAWQWPWPQFCSVFVHEYGHLLGHDHSADPADVMFPVYMGPIAVCAVGRYAA